MKLIAGLGNPGAAYDLTRHNIGFMAADHISAITGITLRKLNFDAMAGCGSWCGHEIMLAKPMTFMNRSGIAIKALAEAFDIHSNDIIIAHDEMDLPFGGLRIKTSGGSGGHRGIASINECISTNAFVRLRIGIGRPPETQAEPDYVLDLFSHTELPKIAAITCLAAQCVEMILTRGIPAAMNKFHTTVLCSEINEPGPFKN